MHHPATSCCIRPLDILGHEKRPQSRHDLCCGLLVRPSCDTCRLLAYFMNAGFLSSLQALQTDPTASASILQRIAAICAACAVVESLPTPSWLNDNFTVPATAAALGTLLLPGSWPEAAWWQALVRVLNAAMIRASGAQPGLIVGAAVNSAVFLLGRRLLRKGLSPSGIMHAWLLGTVVYGVFGAGGYAMVCLFFVVGTLVSENTDFLTCLPKVYLLGVAYLHGPT